MRRWLILCGLMLALATGVWAATVTKQLIVTTSTVTIALNSLAANGTVVSTANVDNRAASASGGGGALLCDIEAALSFVAPPDPDGGLAVWFQETVDESNFATSFIGMPKVVLPVNVVSPATSVRVVRRVDCPAGLFSVSVKNDNTGTALAGSGNTLKIRFVTLEGL